MFYDSKTRAGTRQKLSKCEMLLLFLGLLMFHRTLTFGFVTGKMGCGTWIGADERERPVCEVSESFIVPFQTRPLQACIMILYPVLGIYAQGTALKLVETMLYQQSASRYIRWNLVELSVTITFRTCKVVETLDLFHGHFYTLWVEPAHCKQQLPITYCQTASTLCKSTKRFLSGETKLTF